MFNIIESENNALNEKILTVAFFVVIYMSSSYNISIISGTVSLFVQGIVAVVVLCFYHHIKIDARVILIMFLLFINVILTTYIAQETFKDMAIMLLVLIISTVFILYIDTITLYKIYNKIIYFIAGYSLLVYILSLTFTKVISAFPLAYDRPGMTVYNLGFTFSHLNEYLIRNMGIFWEPGAFQSYLVLAILIEILNYNHVNLIKMFVLFIALITTWSTAGIVNLFILLLILVLEKSKFNLMIKILFILIIMLTIYTFYSILPDNLKYATYGKIYHFLNNDRGFSVVDTASVRYDSIIYPLDSFFKHPIWGVGSGGLSESILTAHTMTTNTVVNWFASYGVIFGSIFTLSIVKFAMLFNNKYKITYFLIFISVILLLSTEQYLRNVSIILVLLSSYKVSFKK